MSYSFSHGLMAHSASTLEIDEEPNNLYIPIQNPLMIRAPQESLDHYLLQYSGQILQHAWSPKTRQASPLPLNPLHHTSRPIRTHLRTSPNTRDIEPHRNECIPPAPHTFSDQSLDGLIPRCIHQIGERPELAAHRRAHDRAEISAPVAGSDGETVDCSENFRDFVAREVVGRRGDNPVGVGEAGGGVVLGSGWRHDT